MLGTTDDLRTTQQVGNLDLAKPADRHVEGVVEMTLDATQNYANALTQERLFDWHAALFPTGRSGMRKIIVGDWRKSDDDPMQVVSGPVGRERVHFEAPAAQNLGAEMRRFLKWCNSDDSLDPVLKSGAAHLWFVTIHPFADGNGRIARAIADLMLAKSEQSPQRFYSMSAEIRAHRKAYYDILEATQKGDLDITDWLDWFLRCLTRSIEHAQSTLAAVLFKARFWENPATTGVNDRQRLMLNKLLDGFDGKLTTKKWASLAKTSHDTALRDIEALIARGLMQKDPAGGRSTSYSLAGQPTAP